MDEDFKILEFWYKLYFKRWQNFDLGVEERELCRLAVNVCTYLAYKDIP